MGGVYALCSQDDKKMLENLMAHMNIHLRCILCLVCGCFVTNVLLEYYSPRNVTTHH